MNLNNLNRAELETLYAEETTTPAEKSAITKHINKMSQSDESGIIDKLNEKEKEKVGLNAIELAVGEYFRTEVQQVQQSDESLSQIAVSIFEQASFDDDYCIELVAMAPDYCMNTLGEIDADVWRNKMISLVYPNYIALANDAENKKTQGKSSKQNSKPYQDMEKANRLLSSVHKAWNKLIKVVGWLEANKATEVSYNVNFKMVSANLWTKAVVDGKEVEGNLGVAMYYISSILKLAPAPDREESTKTTAKKKVQDCGWIELITFMQEKITANGKPKLPKEILNKKGLPILEALVTYNEHLSSALNDTVMALYDTLKDAEATDNENDAEANKQAEATS